MTGLHYNAWPKGPVPVSLFEELQKRQSELADRFALLDKSVEKRSALTITPHFSFDPDLFSNRELRIMRSLC